MNELTKKMLADAIVDTGGVVTSAARKLDIARGTVYTYMRKWNLKPAVDDARAKLKDEAEICIREAIVTHKNWNAAKWYLDRQAQDRGYGTQITLKQTIPDKDMDEIRAALNGDFIAEHKPIQ